MKLISEELYSELYEKSPFSVLRVYRYGKSKGILYLRLEKKDFHFIKNEVYKFIENELEDSIDKEYIDWTIPITE